MAKVITCGLQKGGVGKTTTAAIIGYLLSLEHKVLLVDFDTQGNLSELITQADPIEAVKSGVFPGIVLDAVIERDPRKYIIPKSENLDILISNDNLALLPSYLYENVPKGKRALVLRETLEKVQDQYDYIVIDTPPSLSELTINALGASDGVLILFDCSLFSKSALNQFFDTILSVQEVNPGLKILGILPTLIDPRRTDAKLLLEDLKNDEIFGKYVFDQVITRRAATGRLPFYGFEGNPELVRSVEQYLDVVRELKKRV